MKFIQAYSRDEPPGGGASLEELISSDNEVRFIDAFVDSLPLERLGFRTAFPESGRPAYHPSILLKLLVYGYLNRIRFSRCLERECHRNLEVMWLLGQLVPDHNTIANYTKHRGKSNQTSFHQYRTRACKTCAMRARCTTAKNGKLIERNTYTPVFERNRQNIAAKPELYRRRQAIVEHPFGTIKRQWGYSYVLTKRGMKRAAADVGLMLVAYNLRRIFNIVGLERLLAYAEACATRLSVLGALSIMIGAC